MLRIAIVTSAKHDKALVGPQTLTSPNLLRQAIPWAVMGPSTDESRRMQALRELRTRNYGSLLIRTDFSNEQAWIDIRRRATAPVLVAGGDELLADVRVIDDTQFEGLEIGRASCRERV